jgi:putative two-component system response regulator
VIFISGLNTIEDKIKGFKLGAVDFISKPFDLEEVALRIEAQLKMYKKQQELEVYNKKLYKIINEQIRKINDTHKNMVLALAMVSSLRSQELARYFDVLGNNSRILAISLQLSSNFKEQITNTFIDVIEVAALTHDIGMAVIGHNYVEGELVVADVEQAKQHTVIGAKALENIYNLGGSNEYIKMATDIAKYHHENWDGSGYPFGLSGSEIPLSARIVAIISTYHVYSPENRPNNSHEAGVERVKQGSGTRFDPDIVDVFMKIQNQFKR